MCVQDYKSLCAAVTICATERHEQTAFDQLIWIAQPAELKYVDFGRFCCPNIEFDSIAFYSKANHARMCI